MQKKKEEGEGEKKSRQQIVCERKKEREKNNSTAVQVIQSRLLSFSLSSLLMISCESFDPSSKTTKLLDELI